MEEENISEALSRFLQQPGRSLSTKKKIRYKFKLFLEQYGHERTSDITAATIEVYFHYLKERKNYSEGHLAFHRSIHTTFWGWLGRGEIVTTVERYDETPTVLVMATDEEIHQLLITCERMWATLHQQRDAAIVALGTAGLRRSNIRFIRANEARQVLANPVTVDGRSFCILPTKGKEPMDAILDEQRAAIVRRYLTNRPNTRHDRLFVNLNEHDADYLAPLGDKAFEKSRRRVCRHAGLRVITFQEMRRWLGTKVAKDNNIQIAAKALGHKSGVAVILKHYWNPEKELTQKAILGAYGS